MTDAFNLPNVADDIAYLTETLKSPVDRQLLLRPSLEAALFRLGHSQREIDRGLHDYYAAMRTVH